MNKFLISILFLFFTPKLVQTQVIWNELGAHNREVVLPIHVLKNDNIIGFLEKEEKLLISNDNGKSWTEFYPENNLLSIAFDFIREDDNGNVYFLHENKKKIYKLNTESSEIELFYETNSKIQDYDFLNNGNFFICDSSPGGVELKIILYSPSGIELNFTVFNSHSFKFLLGNNDNHYALTSSGASKKILIFNSDLSEVYHNYEESVPRDDNYFNLDNRLITGRSYSDDGLTWVNYPITGCDILEFVGVTRNKKIVIQCNTKTFISTDRGENFIELDIEIPNQVKYFGSKVIPINDSELLVTFPNKENCFTYHFFNEKWDSITTPLSIGKPFANEIAVVDESKIYAKHYPSCYTCNIPYLNPIINKWNHLDKSCFMVNQLQSNSNGIVLSSDGYISFNRGTDWERHFPYLDYYWFWRDPIFIKEDAMYILSFEHLYKSSDHGFSWEKLPFILNVPYPYIYPNIIKVSSADEIFYYLESKLYRYKFNESVRINLPSSLSLRTFETPYSSPYLHILSRRSDEKLFLLIAEDTKATSFLKREIPESISYSNTVKITFDNYDNIILYTTSDIYISYDKGASWENITPPNSKLITFNKIEKDFDNHLYIGCYGSPILKTKEAIKAPSELQANLYLDINNNCKRDIEEIGLENVEVQFGKSALSITNDQGEAKTQILHGTHKITPYLREDLYTVCPEDIYVTVLDGNPFYSRSIAVQIKESCADIRLSTSIPHFLRCEDNNYFFEILNSGSDVAKNVSLSITIDEDLELINNDLEILNVMDNEYLFSIGDIPSGSNFKGKIKLNVPCNSDPGQIHSIYSKVVFKNQCNLLLEKSIDTLNRVSSEGFVSNNKSVIINGDLDKSFVGIDDDLEYIISFQNQGAATVKDIRIEDLLNSHYNINSIKPIISSHDYEYLIERNNLIIKFKNINLPSKFDNETESHGFIKFKIQFSENTPLPGTIIRNKAKIYFDSNAPLYTNTTEINFLCERIRVSIDTSICSNDTFENYTTQGSYLDTFNTTSGCDSIRYLYLFVLSQSSPECIKSNIDDSPLDKLINIYPNPVDDILYIKSEDSYPNLNYSIINALGQEFRSGKVLELTNEIDVSDLHQGVYFIKILKDKKVIELKKVIVL